MGGRGGSSGIGADSSKMNTAPALEKQISSIKDQLYNIVRDNGSAMGLPRKYYNLQEKRQRLERKLSDLYRKEDEERTKKAMSEKFVNGYGEATHREITSLSYKRAEAIRNRDLNNWFGRGMQNMNKKRK